MCESSPNLTLTVDDREGRSGLARALAERWKPVEVSRLPVGDVRVGRRVIVERKTVSDLILSLESGRLFRQCSAPCDVAPRPLLVIEGEDAFDARVLAASALRGVLLTLLVGFRLPLLRTGSTRETAEFLAQLARQETRRLDRSRRREATRSAHEDAIAVLGAVPGLGDGRARRLLDAFGSVREVLEAQEEEILEVPGVGPGTARSLRRIAGEVVGQESEEGGAG